MIIIYMLSVLLYQHTWHLVSSAGLNVKLITDKAIHVTDERYLSVALDPSLIYNRWRKFDPTSQRVRTLAKALSPAYLRIGGTLADFLTFQPGKAPNQPPTTLDLDTIDWRNIGLLWKTFENFTMYGSDWNLLNDFAKAVNYRIVFDFNVLKRSKGEWDDTNARLLLDYSINHGYSKNLDFELGNEPNSFHHSINRSLSATQLGRDFIKLHGLLHKPAYRADYGRSLLVGPDTTRATKKSVKYMKQFMKVAAGVIDRITFHQYYINGRTANLSDFVDPKVLKLLPQQLKMYKRSLKQAGYGAKPLWLGETSSAWGGGAPDLSDRYVAGFMWLDKLGQAAKLGLDVVIRQSLYQGHYALLDNDMNPTPDYWLSVLFKRLVGRQVLEVSLNKSSSLVRVYAQCTSTSQGIYRPGSVTVYALNLKKKKAKLYLPSNYSVDMYLLTPPPQSDLQSSYVALNGKTLMLTQNDEIPPLLPRPLLPGKPAVLPPRTFGFFIIPDIKAKACLHGSGDIQPD